MDNNLFYCTRCKLSFSDPQLMCWVKGKVRNRCKQCHSKEESERRSRLGDEGYRNISLDKLVAVKLNGKTYKFEDKK